MTARQADITLQRAEPDSCAYQRGTQAGAGAGGGSGGPGFWLYPALWSLGAPSSPSACEQPAGLGELLVLVAAPWLVLRDCNLAHTPASTGLGDKSSRSL